MNSSDGTRGTIRGIAELRRADQETVPAQSVQPLASSGRVELEGGWQGFIEVEQRAIMRREGSVAVSKEHILALDGVLWGSFLGTGAKELAALIDHRGESIVKDLRGSFSVVSLNQEKDELKLFADPIRSRNLFWNWNSASGGLQFSSDLFDLVDIMRSAGLAIRRDDLASWYMLTFGYMLDDRTLIEGVRRVSPGSVLVFDGRSVREEEVLRFCNEPFEGKRDKSLIIDGLEDRFRAAVGAAFARDTASGYEHIAHLSGGLDSRAVVITATQMGFRPILTCTTAVSGYLDQTIAARVARDLGLDNLFYSLDNGSYLVNLETAVRANGGLVFAAGSAHMLDFFRSVNLDRFGVMHTGMLGDAVLGTFLHGPNHAHSNPATGANSMMMSEKARELAQPVWARFDTDEIYKLYARGFNAILNGFHSLAKFVTSESPFLDPDFLSYCLSIPPDLRFASTGAGIYRDWILAKRGRVGRFQWERTGVPASAPTLVARASMYGRAFARRVPFVRFQGSMVPMSEWYRTNHELSGGWTETFNLGISALSSDPELKAAAAHLFSEGSVPEKSQVLTLLIASDLFGLG